MAASSPNERFDLYFSEFTRLRDELRQAKKGKQYQDVIALVGKLADLDEVIGGNIIAMEFFLKDMGKACQKLDNHASALACFQKSRERFAKALARAAVYQKDAWRRDIAIIDKLIERERAILAKPIP